MDKSKNKRAEFIGQSTHKRFDPSPQYGRDQEPCFYEIRPDPEDEPVKLARTVDANWQSHLAVAFTKYLVEAEKASLALAVFRTERRLRAVEVALAKGRRSPFPAKIASLADHGLAVKKEIPIVVQPDGDEYTATFMDADIGMSGDTDTEAVSNLRDILASIFKKFAILPASKLGPGPAAQLAVLREFIEMPAQ